LSHGFLNSAENELQPLYMSQKLKAPFLVVEGLDGTGNC